MRLPTSIKKSIISLIEREENLEKNMFNVIQDVTEQSKK